MTSADKTWACNRLAAFARDARELEASTYRWYSASYSTSARLAALHATVAALYEAAQAEIAATPVGDV